MVFGNPVLPATSGPVARDPQEMTSREIAAELKQIAEWQTALETGLQNQRAELQRLDGERHAAVEAARLALLAGPRTTYAGQTTIVPGEREFDQAERLQRDVKDAAAACSAMQARIDRSHEMLGVCSSRSAQLSAWLESAY